MLKISTLQKSYAFNQVLDVSELYLPAGVHFIIGPNGAGKTTFLKCLAGIQNFEGKAVLDTDIDLQKDPVAHRKSINFSEAEPQFPEYLTGDELLNFTLKVKEGQRSEAEAFCAQTGIDYLDQKVGTYSSGMKKKLAILLAFVGQAKLILLDEPFSAVDQKSRIAITALIRAKADAGVSFFVSSHQRDLHAAFGEGQVWLLEDKTFRPVTDAEVDEWLQQHANQSSPDAV